MKRPPSAGILWLLAVCSAAAAPRAASEGAPPSAEESHPSIPSPDLSALEPAVAAQLGALRVLAEEAIRDRTTSDRERGGTWGELGRHYHAYGLAGPARICYQQATGWAPEDFRWWYYLARLELGEGRLDAAGLAFERALDLQPDDLPALLGLGEVDLQLDRLESLERALRKALHVAPGSAAAHALAGELALSRGEYSAAVESLELALAAVPEANRLHYPLALAYRGLGDLDRARKHLSRQGPVGVRPSDPLMEELQTLTRGETVSLLRGRRAFRAGRYGEAVAAFREAVAVAPESSRARINLAAALAESGDPGAAIAELEEVLRLSPESATGHYNLGLLRARSGDLDGAVDSLRTAASLDPADAAAVGELARLLARMGRSRDALDGYSRAIDLEPGNERFRVGQAQILVSLGRSREALEGLEEAHESMAMSEVVTVALARLLAASPDPSLRDGPRAVALALQVFEAHPTAGHAETVALALAESGRCEEAAAWQRRALAGLGEGASAEETARVQESVGRYEQGPDCRPPSSARERDTGAS